MTFECWPCCELAKFARGDMIRVKWMRRLIKRLWALIIQSLSQFLKWSRLSIRTGTWMNYLVKFDSNQYTARGLSCSCQPQRRSAHWRVAYERQRWNCDDLIDDSGQTSATSGTTSTPSPSTPPESDDGAVSQPFSDGLLRRIHERLRVHASSWFLCTCQALFYVCGHLNRHAKRFSSLPNKNQYGSLVLRRYNW